MIGHISIAVSKNCYNLYESYGEICVGCGCCSSDKQRRIKARLALNRRMLKEEQEFDRWADDPEIRALQEKNVAENILLFEKEIAKYEAELADGGAEGCESHTL